MNDLAAIGFIPGLVEMHGFESTSEGSWRLNNDEVVHRVIQYLQSDVQQHFLIVIGETII